MSFKGKIYLGLATYCGIVWGAIAYLLWSPELAIFATLAVGVVAFWMLCIVGAGAEVAE